MGTCWLALRARVQALTPSASQMGDSDCDRLQSTVQSEGRRNHGNIPVVLYLGSVRVVTVFLDVFCCCVESPH